MSIPENLKFIYLPKNRLNSVNSLAKILEVNADELIQTASQQYKYKSKKIPKKNGKIRIINKPSPSIRKVQNLLNHRFIRPNIKWPSYIYGCIPNSIDTETQLIIRKDYVACASAHCQAKSILHLDISDFFDNISNVHIKNIFTNFFNIKKEDVCNKLTEIVTYKNSLPQGGLTSSYLASLLFFDSEPLIVHRLNSKGLTYTRLIDDITLSTKKPNYDFKSEIITIRNMLSNYDLHVNEEKMYIEHFSTKPMVVHSLRVDQKHPRYDKREIRRIRTLIHNIQEQAKIPTYRNNYFYRKDYYRCMGTINKLSRTNQYYHRNFLKKIIKLSPLPCLKDIKNLNILIEKLENTPIEHRNLFHFLKRKNIAKNRISLIKKIYTHEAKKLAGRIDALK